MEWFENAFNKPVAIALKKAKLRCRPAASAGAWVPFLLPSAVLLGALQTPEASEQYQVAAVVASGMFGASVALVRHLINSGSGPAEALLRTFNLTFLVPATFTTLLLFFYAEQGFFFSVFGGIVSTFPYCVCLPRLLQVLPGIFTFGEASILVQGAILFLFSTFTNLSARFIASDAHLDSMSKATLILQVGLLGLAAICVSVTLAPALRHPRQFCALLIGIMGGAVVPALCIILRENPVIWILHFIFDDLQRVYTIIRFMLKKVYLVVYWAVCSGVAIMAVCTQVQGAYQASTAVRKTFHLLVLAVYVPGLAWECALTHLASGVALAALITIELVRLLNIGPLGGALQQSFLVFADEKDCGGVALTPIYLLAGCSAPLWIHPARCALRASVALPVFSGLLSVGIGDTAASIFGSSYGSRHWPGSKKTVEGTMACIVAQLVCLVIFSTFGFVPSLSFLVWVRASFAITLVSFAEALTDQVDNLVLPLLIWTKRTALCLYGYQLSVVPYSFGHSPSGTWDYPPMYFLMAALSRDGILLCYGATGS